MLCKDLKTVTLTEGFFKVLNEKKSKNIDGIPAQKKTKVKFEIYGEEMIEKEVKLSGNSGRIYLPPDWVGHQVKIIRTD
jgi:putative transposon-encoded protein